MLHAFLIFLATAGISFTGSLQLGPLNLAAMQATLQRSKRAGLIIGVGGSVPEFIYSFLALVAAAWLSGHKDLVAALEWCIVPLLLFLGVMNLRKRKKEEAIAEMRAENHAMDFAKGFVISLLNAQMFPFWLSVLIMLNGYEFFRITDAIDKAAFVIGTGVGEFLLIGSVVLFTHRYRDFFLRKLNSWNISTVFGWIFLGLAALQAGKLLLR